MDLRRFRRRMLLLPLLFGAVAILFLLPGGQAGGAVLIGPVPLAVGTSPAVAAAALLLLLGLFILATGRMLWTAAESERERRLREPPPPAPEEAGAPGRTAIRGAGVVMIGPLPIALGNDPRLLRFTLLLALALTALGVAAALLVRA